MLAASFSAYARAGEAGALAPPPEGWGAAHERAAVEYWGEAPRRCASTGVDLDSRLPLGGHWLCYGDSPSDRGRSVTAEFLGEFTVDAPCHRLVAAVRSGGSD